jgi:hypothetical protein
MMAMPGMKQDFMSVKRNNIDGRLGRVAIVVRNIRFGPSRSLPVVIGDDASRESTQLDRMKPEALSSWI